MKEAIITGPESTPNWELTPMRVHEIALMRWCHANFFVADGYPTPVIFAKPMDAFGQFKSLWKKPDNPFTYLLQIKDKKGTPLYQPYPEPAMLPLISINRRKQTFRTLQNYSIHRNRHVSWPTVDKGVTREDLGAVRVRNRPMAVSFHLDVTFLCLRPDTQAVFMQRVWNCFWRSGGRPQTWIPVAYPTELGLTNVHMELEGDITDTTADDPGDSQVLFRTSFSVRIDGWQLDLQDLTYPAIWYQVINFNLAISPTKLLPLFSTRTDMRPIEENYALDTRGGIPKPPVPLPPVTETETEFIAPPAGGYKVTLSGTFHSLTSSGTLAGGDSVIFGRPRVSDLVGGGTLVNRDTMSGAVVVRNFTASGTLAGGDSLISTGVATIQDFIGTGTLLGGDSIISSGVGLVQNLIGGGVLLGGDSLISGAAMAQSFIASGTLSMPSEYVFLPTDSDQRGGGLEGSLLSGFAVDGQTAFAMDGLNEIYSSTDGLNWAIIGKADGNLVTLAYGAGLLVGAGMGGDIESSTTGETSTWVSRTSGTSQWLHDLVYSAGRFVAVGDNGATTTSTNGTSWTPSTAGTGTLRAIACGGGIFVAVGDGPVVYTSTNGVNWFLQSLPATAATTLLSVTFSPTLGLFVAAGDSGTVLTATDGTDWTDHSGDPFGIYDQVSGLAWGNGHFTAVTLNGGVYASSGGTAWTHIMTDPNNAMGEQRVYFFGSNFYILQTYKPA